MGILLSQHINAQMPNGCGLDLNSNSNDTTPTVAGCIDIDEILAELANGDNCRFIYLNINVHFFVNSDCSGDLIVPAGRKPSEANSIAEALIGDANYKLYQNFTQWNQAGSVKLCNPFQYVLKGVYIHCDNSTLIFQARNQISSIQNLYGINKNSEFNLFISPCLNCSGVAEAIGGPFTGLNLADLTAGALNHEIGHLMGLDHSWIEDGISDTPPINFDLDRNCDGIISNNFNDQEREQQCFNKLVGTDPVISAYDKIGASSGSNGIHDCNETNPCPVHPCCFDQWQNNNTMAYNAHQNSFTFGQIKNMLGVLNDFKCELINSINSNRNCPPPNAFISTPLQNISGGSACSNCFDLSASYNEEKYKIKVYEIVGGIETLVQDRPWVIGNATKICFNNSTIIPIGNFQILKSNTHYKFELIVDRLNPDCSDPHSASKEFTTGNCPPYNALSNDPNFQTMIAMPNPGSGDCLVSFVGAAQEGFNVYALNQSNGQIIDLYSNFISSLTGLNSITLDTDNLASGNYIILAIGESHQYYCNWINYNLWNE
ncbi:MAG TPA: M43 family zinc metalloprotease [Saprospiraceae bacterium]|nr:M43 family zinc metalloprotease [Saprospiraceae bacterium]